MSQLITSLIVVVTIMHVFLLGVAYLILLERKIAAWAQDRIGPNRVGLTFGLLPESWGRYMLGLGQPLADGLKFMAKEDYNPGHVDRGLFILAPVLAVIPALLGWAVIPWGGILEATDGLLGSEALRVSVIGAELNIGVIYILATGSLAVYGVSIGAWAANNKYTFLGGLRATAQMLSYEIPLGVCILCMILMSGSARADHLIIDQVGYWWGFLPQWNIFQQPLIAALFFTCILAEANRAPFDLAECEQELIGGFHTEYSSMKFALFFLGEYMHMITSSAFFTLLFLGGWHLPWIDQLLYGGAQPAAAGLGGVLLKVGVFLGKVIVLLAIMMWIRWTVPRFRFDQLMQLAWRALIPITIAMLLVTALFVQKGWEGYLWLANLGMIAAVLFISPFIPADRRVNQRVPLAGSRFSPLVESKA